MSADLMSGEIKHYVRRGASGNDRGIVAAIVKGSEADKIRFYPMGGGPVYVMSADEFFEEFELISDVAVAELFARYEGTFVSGAWFDEGARPIPAYASTQRWNGFVCPAFEKEHLDEAIADGLIEGLFYVKARDVYVHISTDGAPLPGVDLAKIAEKLKETDCEVQFGSLSCDVETFQARQILTQNGPVKVYDIGAGGWCWDLAEEPMASNKP